MKYVEDLKNPPGDRSSDTLFYGDNIKLSENSSLCVARCACLFLNCLNDPHMFRTSTFTEGTKHCDCHQLKRMTA